MRASTFKRKHFALSDRQLLVPGDLRTLAKTLSPRRQSLCDRHALMSRHTKPAQASSCAVARSLWPARYSYCRLLGIDAGTPYGYHCLRYRLSYIPSLVCRILSFILSRLLRQRMWSTLRRHWSRLSRQRLNDPVRVLKSLGLGSLHQAPRVGGTFGGCTS